jgi:hypothetical protein
LMINTDSDTDADPEVDMLCLHCFHRLLKLQMDLDDFGAVADADWRAPGADTIRHIEMGVADLLVSPCKLEDGSDDVIDGPELAVVCMARNLQIYPSFCNFSKSERLVIHEDYGISRVD